MSQPLWKQSYNCWLLIASPVCCSAALLIQHSTLTSYCSPKVSNSLKFTMDLRIQPPQGENMHARRGQHSVSSLKSVEFSLWENLMVIHSLVVVIFQSGLTDRPTFPDSSHLIPRSSNIVHPSNPSHQPNCIWWPETQKSFSGITLNSIFF